MSGVLGGLVERVLRGLVVRVLRGLVGAGELSGCVQKKN